MKRKALEEAENMKKQKLIEEKPLVAKLIFARPDFRKAPSIDHCFDKAFLNTVRGNDEAKLALSKRDRHYYVSVYSSIFCHFIFANYLFSEGRQADTAETCLAKSIRPNTRRGADKSRQRQL